MSATLLTYNSQRETRLKGQERATQPSASVGVSPQFCGTVVILDLSSRGEATVAFRRLCSGSWDYSVQMRFLTPGGRRVEVMCSW